MVDWLLLSSLAVLSRNCHGNSFNLQKVATIRTNIRDADEIHLCVIFEAILAALSTNAGLLEAAKGRRIGQSVVGVHLPSVGKFWLL